MKSWAKSRLHFAALLGALSLSASLGAQHQDAAASRAAAVLASMPHATKIDQVAISPDGTRVAYIVEGQLTVTAVSGGSLRAVSLEDKLALREVTWSADGKQLAFLADLQGDIPVAQVWTAAVDGGAPAKRAELRGYADATFFARRGEPGDPLY